MNNSYYSIFTIVILFGLMYFLMIRPQKKQEQKRRERLSKIKPGDQVITIGRLHGVVDEVNTAEKTVTLDCDGIYLVFDLNAIAQIKQPAVSVDAVSEEAAVKDAPKDVEEITTEEQPEQSEKTDDK